MRFLLFIAISLAFLGGCSLDRGSDDTEGGSGSIYRNTMDADERVALAKKRRSYITGIRKGDYYSLRNAPEEALSYYLAVAERLPGDQVVKKKIAHVLYLMKDWGQAYQEYIKVPLSELSETEKNEMLASLYFDTSTFDRLSELSKIGVQTGTIDYLRVVDTCYGTIHDCVVGIESYTGGEYRVQLLKDQIRDAAKISPDFQYRNLSLAAKFYEQGMYRAAERITASILAERPDYSEGLKILGFSLYELGNYEGARKYILEYLEKHPTDLDSIIRLGEISAKLGDYITSNLYYNNAVTAGYKKKTDIERRLAYNYARLSDTVGTIKVLNYLLAEPDVTEDDYAVGISMAIMDGQYARAESWAKSGLEKFTDSHIITPLYIQSLRLQGLLDSASSILQNTPLEDMIDNPNYLLEKAILTYELGDPEGAKDIFRELISLDEWPDIQDEARLYLEQIIPNM